MNKLMHRFSTKVIANYIKICEQLLEHNIYTMPIKGDLSLHSSTHTPQTCYSPQTHTNNNLCIHYNHYNTQQHTDHISSLTTIPTQHLHLDHDNNNTNLMLNSDNPDLAEYNTRLDLQINNTTLCIPKICVNHRP